MGINISSEIDPKLGLSFNDYELKMREYAIAHEVPIITDEGLKFLEETIKKYNVKTILEIGSAIGYSAERMAKCNDAVVYSIERDSLMFEEASKNIKELGLENNIKLIFKDALDAYPLISDIKFDLIFIDAAKGQYKRFFEIYEKNLNIGGIIVCDNMNFHGFTDKNLDGMSRSLRGLVRKLNDFHDFLKTNNNYETEFYDIGDGMSISKKLKNKERNLREDEILITPSMRVEFVKQITKAKQLMAYYECAIMEVETKFKVLNKQFSLMSDRNPIDSIQSRLKSPESILDKIIRKQLPLTLDSIENNLSDIAGIRVICSFIEDIYVLKSSIEKQDDLKILEVKDYIKNPKPNGYRSLHMIVEIPIYLSNEKKPMKVEIQLRTIAMQTWASLEHQIFYKKEYSETDKEIYKEKLRDAANLSYELDVDMQKIKNETSNKILKK